MVESTIAFLSTGGNGVSVLHDNTKKQKEIRNIKFLIMGVYFFEIKVDTLKDTEIFKSVVGCKMRAKKGKFEYLFYI
ncbi:pyridoxal-dependent decarboxylase [Chryseobacterium sp. StRB126]|nr:pyridoxal-dependent decarboxylase [Chryseobacterium sp. StRB126]